MPRALVLLALLVPSVLAVACGSSDSGDGSPSGGASAGGSSAAGAQGKPCAASSDCGSGAVCTTVGSQSFCSITCSGSADACGAQAQCGGLAGVSVSVCEPKKADAQAAPKPEEQKRLTCKTDADCDALQKGAVCGSYKGARGCSIVCAQDAACNPPAAGGLATSFFHCGSDESMPSRNVCLPREECFSNPSACYTFSGGAGGFGGAPGGPGGLGGAGGGFDPGTAGGFGGDTGFGGDMGFGGDSGFGG